MNDRQILRTLLRSALEAVDPRGAVSRVMASPSLMRLLRKASRVGVFACGKAARSMVLGLSANLRRDSLVVLPRGYPSAGLPASEVLFASHPVPDASSVKAARRAMEYFSSFDREDVILCLISGGASSLLARPLPGLTLEAKRRAVLRLMRSGASIVKINRLRKSLSAVKGGKLGRVTRARLATLVLSDVPGDDPGLVGSGPTVRNRPGDVTLVVGSNRLGLQAAARTARRLRLTPRIFRERLSGEARLEGMRFARAASGFAAEVLLAGGETTVTLGKHYGRGGRSLEFALGAAIALEGLERLVILAAASDGVDGNSKAAGAFAGGATVSRASRLGLDPEKALASHDTEPFFRRLGDLLITGPTGTNVCDWAFAVRT